MFNMKEENEKFGLKYSFKKKAPGAITSWQIDGEIIETVTDLIFLGSKIIVDGD